MNTLDAQVQKVKTELKERLSQQKYLCLTADAWTSRAQSYLGVTCHFINEHYEREPYLLAFRQMKQRQTYDVLAKAMHDILQDFGIKISQITNIVTDGGSNFCKMFKRFGDSIDVVTLDTDGEEIELDNDENNEIAGNNDADSNEIANSLADIVQEYMCDENGEQFVNEILTFDVEASLGSDREADDGLNSETGVDVQNFDPDYNGYFGEIDPIPQMVSEQDQIRLPPQRRCMSHLLNQLGTDFEKNLGGLAKAAFQSTFNALHSLWVIVGAWS